MKGRITPKLARILEDKQARGQLGEILARGEDGVVNLGSKTYSVRLEKLSSQSSKERGRKPEG